MTQSHPTKDALMLQTNLYPPSAASKDHSDNLTVFFQNIKIYSILIAKKIIDAQTLEKLGEKIMNQSMKLWLDEPFDKFSSIFSDFDNLDELIDIQFNFLKVLDDIEILIRRYDQLRKQATSEENFNESENMINRYVSDLQIMLEQPQQTAHLLKAYTVYKIDDPSPSNEANSSIDIPTSHFFKETIQASLPLQPMVFSWAKPNFHQIYLSEVAKGYHDVCAIKIKHICLSGESPSINQKDYFEVTDPTKSIVGYCVPGTNVFAFYFIADICKTLSITKDFYQERSLAIDWKFSNLTKSVICSDGRIFAINCRSTEQKIDSYFYEINQAKASNRGPLLSAKRDASLVYLNNYIYLIGGAGGEEKCSNCMFRYNCKDKKWSARANSNVALRKPTVCSIGTRYICKLGGLNQFDYISKVIEVYDTITDKWSLVRASPKNILESVEILEDSQAVQINEDQVYIFGGINSNGFASDKGFILMIGEIKERKKGPAKVTAEYWNASIGKRNLLSFNGVVNQSNPVVHFGCIYTLRKEIIKALPPSF